MLEKTTHGASCCRNKVANEKKEQRLKEADGDANCNPGYANCNPGDVALCETAYVLGDLSPKHVVDSCVQMDIEVRPGCMEVSVSIEKKLGDKGILDHLNSMDHSNHVSAIKNFDPVGRSTEICAGLHSGNEEGIAEASICSGREEVKIYHRRGKHSDSSQNSLCSPREEMVMCSSVPQTNSMGETSVSFADASLKSGFSENINEVSGEDHSLQDATGPNLLNKHLEQANGSAATTTEGLHPTPLSVENRSYQSTTFHKEDTVFDNKSNMDVELPLGSAHDGSLEGINESKCDDSNYKNRHPRRGRSTSRSPCPSPPVRRRTSLWRRWEQRSRSRSLSPKKWSRSRSPCWRAGDFGSDRLTQSTAQIPECLDFRRGRCNRGARCRYLHDVGYKYDRPRHDWSMQQPSEISQSLRYPRWSERFTDRPRHDWSMQRHSEISRSPRYPRWSERFVDRPRHDWSMQQHSEISQSPRHTRWSERFVDSPKHDWSMQRHSEISRSPRCTRWSERFMDRPRRDWSSQQRSEISQSPRYTRWSERFVDRPKHDWSMQRHSEISRSPRNTRWSERFMDINQRASLDHEEVKSNNMLPSHDRCAGSSFGSMDAIVDDKSKIESVKDAVHSGVLVQDGGAALDGDKFEVCGGPYSCLYGTDAVLTSEQNINKVAGEDHSLKDAMVLDSSSKHFEQRNGVAAIKMQDFLPNPLMEHESHVSAMCQNNIGTSDDFSSIDKCCINVKLPLDLTRDGTLAASDKDDNSEKISESSSKLLSPSDPAAQSSRRKLLILDLNGLLADIVQYFSDKYTPDTTISRKAVFKRPFCDDFLQFCLENFDVGIWSSRTRKNVDGVVDFLMGDAKKKLLFCWDQSHCTNTGYNTMENKNKPLVLKELKKLWEKQEPDLPWEKGQYDESNTLLLDDSPYKALRNPPYTAIFPHPYVYTTVKDTSLGPGGDLRVYLERLVAAENVQTFVKENPFGQRPITKSNLSWAFYAKIIEAETGEPEGKVDSASAS